MHRSIRFLTLLLAGLGLTLGGAHVLELGPKMRYDPELYAAVTSTLYRSFGTIGAVVQIAAVVAALALAVVSRRLRSFRLMALGAGALVLSLLLWGALVAPVNAEWVQVAEQAPASVAAAYARLRPRWEYGHAAAFAAWLAGFALLLGALVRDSAEH